ncbi:uncharacterized protein LOC133474974 [Phyllopteryx taeniolatus]|uniref:uncharacterized protein LOC133474974 n=1 Tax=Phyllopteryx taeniolatus TaxID=161469 RepID=UPI002AD2A73E|nr:uncharacterized protein LOC133474974 [Phyllopteryx taeniolatus]
MIGAASSWPHAGAAPTFGFVFLHSNVWLLGNLLEAPFRGPNFLLDSPDGEELNPFSFREFLRTKDRDRDEDEDEDEDASVWGVCEDREQVRVFVCAAPRGERLSLTGAISELRRTSEANGRRSARRATAQRSDRNVSVPCVQGGGAGGGASSLSRNDVAFMDKNQGGSFQMTSTLSYFKRALRAESSVCRMKAELRQLQVRHTLTGTPNHTTRHIRTHTTHPLTGTNHTRKRKVLIMKGERNPNLHGPVPWNFFGLGSVYTYTHTRDILKPCACVRALRKRKAEIITAMKQNANMASEYPDKTATRAHSSISQLLEGAESLRLVSQPLRSVHKMKRLSTSPWKRDDARRRSVGLSLTGRTLSHTIKVGLILFII